MTSTDAVCYVRFSSAPAVRCAQLADIPAVAGNNSNRPKADERRDATEGPLPAHCLRSGPTREFCFPVFSGASADDAHGPSSREAPERTFLVAGVAGITQVFAAVRRSDSMNWAARDPRASRPSDDDRISIS